MESLVPASHNRGLEWLRRNQPMTRTASPNWRNEFDMSRSLAALSAFMVAVGFVLGVPTAGWSSDQVSKFLKLELEGSLRCEVHAPTPASRGCPEDFWEFRPQQSQLVVFDEAQQSKIVLRADLPHPVDRLSLLGLFDGPSGRVAVVDASYSCFFPGARRESAVSSWLFIALGNPPRVVSTLHEFGTHCSDRSERFLMCAWIWARPVQRGGSVAIAAEVLRWSLGQPDRIEGTFFVRPEDSGLMGAINEPIYPSGYLRLKDSIPDAIRKHFLPLACGGPGSGLEFCILQRPITHPPERILVGVVRDSGSPRVSGTTVLPWNSPVTARYGGHRDSRVRKPEFAGVDLSTLDPRTAFEWPEDTLAEFERARFETLVQRDSRALVALTIPCTPTMEAEPGLLPENETLLIDVDWSQGEELRLTPYLVSTCQMFFSTKGLWPTFENGTLRVTGSAEGGTTVEMTWYPPKILEQRFGRLLVEAPVARVENEGFSLLDLTGWPDDLEAETLDLCIDDGCRAPGPGATDRVPIGGGRSTCAFPGPD